MSSRTIPARAWDGLAAAAGVLAAALVVAFAGGPALADPDLDAIEREREEAEARHSELSAEEAEALERLEELEAEVSLAVEEYHQVNAELDAIDDEIAERERSVASLTERVAEGRDDVGQLVRGMYQSGGGLDEYRALMGTERPGDAARRLGYLRSSQRGHRGLIESLVSDAAVLERERDELAAARERQAELAADLEERRADLEARVAEQEGEVAELRSLLEDAETEIAAADAAEEEILAERRREQQRREEERRAQEREEEREQQRREEERAGRGPDASDDGAAEAPDPPSDPSDAAAVAVDAALSQIGVPYQWGGSSPGTGFDCSGLTSWAYRQAGVSIPRTSRAQLSGLPNVSRGDLRPGDLVAFGSPVHHIAIYIGNGQMVEAPYSGQSVRVRSMDRSDFAGAARPTAQ